MRRAIAILTAAAWLAVAPAAWATSPRSASASAAAEATSPHSASAPAAVSFHSADGLKVTSVKQLDARLLALTVQTTALPGTQNIRILLPSSYQQHPHRHYPVLYLLDGTSGQALDWTTYGDAEQITAGKPLIVVMPDITLNGNGGGWCTDWPDGAQKWETYHINQLIPWVDGNLRTIANRNGRAIAGLSQGGFCSLSYAARHPDLFSVALGYSGAPDIWYDEDSRLGAMTIINLTELGLTGVAPDTFFGNPVTDGINWAAHDPATLAENLRDTRIYMYWGSGLPGPYDSSPDPYGMVIEGAVCRDNDDFQARLDALGIPAYFKFYGAGTHSWPYWERDLRWSIGQIMSDFAHPMPLPTQITYSSGDDDYAVYGWSVDMHRLAREFSTLADAARTGFELSGSGSATVLTPPDFKPGRSYSVGLFGPYVDTRQTLRAGRDRRLTIQVPLGPSNPYQEYTAQAEAAGTTVYTTNVTIAPV